MNIGVIGTGSFGSKRAAAVKDSRAELLGVADADAERCQAAADKLGVKAYTVDDILNDKSIDIIIICVPNCFHRDLAVRAMQSGKHVLVEKPIARNSSEAAEMVDVAKDCGVKLRTGSNHRFFSSVMKAKELVDAGTIGDVISFNGRIGHNGERLQGLWFWDKEKSGGGTLLDNGCHLLDIARWFLGDFESGTGLCSNSYWKDCPVEDSASGVFVTKTGEVATINTSWRQLSGYIHFEINGSKGYVTLDGRFDTHGGDNLYWQSMDHGKEIHSLNFGHVRPNSYVDEINDFLTDIETDRKPSPSGEDGLAVVKMVEAIYESNGKLIPV